MAIVAGIILLLGGIFKAGVIANFLSKPVLVGYLNALALTIIVKQLPKILGYSVEAENVLAAAWETIAKLGQTVPLSLIVGGGCLLIIFGFQRWLPKIPGALVAVVVATIASAWFGFAALGLKVVGTIPSGLPSFAFPRIDLADLGLYLLPAVAIALMGFADTAVTSELFADRNKYDIDPDRDLYGLGAASLLSGLFGGFAVSASDSRTAVSENAGGKSQVTNLIGVAVIGLVLVFFSKLLQPLPNAALGAVVISAGVTLLDIKTFRRAWKERRSDFWIGMLAFVGALVLGLLPGIVIAVLFSLWNVLMQGAKTELVELTRSDIGNVWRNARRQPEGYVIPGLSVVRWEAGLFFGNSKGFERQVKELVARSDPKPKWLVFDAEATGDADFTATTMLESLVDLLREQGVTFGVAEPTGRLLDSLPARRHRSTDRRPIHLFLGGRSGKGLSCRLSGRRRPPRHSAANGIADLFQQASTHGTKGHNPHETWQSQPVGGSGRRRASVGGVCTRHARGRGSAPRPRCRPRRKRRAVRRTARRTPRRTGATAATPAPRIGGSSAPNTPPAAAAPPSRRSTSTR